MHSAALAAVWLLWGCMPSACSRLERTGSSAPSVLLITIDTLRADRLSCYGYAAQQTPAIDALAREGVRFEVAVCDIPWTTGSMASVMTGTFSTKHGLHLPSERLPESRLTFAEVMKHAAYQTGAIVGSFPVGSLYGLNQGFDSYDEEFSEPVLLSADQPRGSVQRVPPPSNPDDPVMAAKWAAAKMRNDAYRPDAKVSDRAIEWLQGHRGSAFFLWVHYFGPHERILKDVPVSDQESRIVAAYDGDLQKTNAAVDRLLTAVRDLGLDKELLVVLHADHGQSLGEHSFVGHGEDLYDASIRIPLLMRFPGRIPNATRVQQLVRNVDIMPTTLDLLGIPIPRDLDGRSLRPVIEGKELPGVPSYSETYTPTVVLQPVVVPEMGTVLGPMTRRAIRTEGWKFVESTFSRPCRKGTSAHRSRTLGHIDQWELQAAAAVAPEECDRLRVQELYDLTTDSAEVRNVAVTHSDVVGQLEPVLQAAAERKAEGEKIILSPEDRERLGNLGYHTGNE